MPCPPPQKGRGFVPRSFHQGAQKKWIDRRRRHECLFTSVTSRWPPHQQHRALPLPPGTDTASLPADSRRCSPPRRPSYPFRSPPPLPRRPLLPPTGKNSTLPPLPRFPRRGGRESFPRGFRFRAFPRDVGRPRRFPLFQDGMIFLLSRANKKGDGMGRGVCDLFLCTCLLQGLTICTSPG